MPLAIAYMFTYTKCTCKGNFNTVYNVSICPWDTGSGYLQRNFSFSNTSVVTFHGVYIL